MEVMALPLRPDLAKVGVEIRVVGYRISRTWLTLVTMRERNYRKLLPRLFLL